MRHAILIFSILFSITSFAAQTKVFGPKILAIPRGQTSYSFTSPFSGFFNGALGSLQVTNGFGVNIPSTPCTGTKTAIKICQAARDLALLATPTSFEVLINGNVVIAKGSIPRTQGSAKVAIAVNTTNVITVNLKGGCGAFITLSATSENIQPVQNPIANFTFTPTSGIVPLTVNFDGSSSSTPNGAITNYAWSFGDGIVVSGISNPSHIYNIAGTYSVTLTVTDSAGKTATKASQVVVNAAVIPIASFSYTVNTTTGAIIVTADGSASSGNGSIVSYNWSWGDGSPNDTGLAIPTVSHTYAVAGTYNVLLLIIDSAGFSASQVQTITVP